MLGWLAPPRCGACDAWLAREAVFCGQCVETLEPPPVLPAGASASFAYGGALAEAIRACKFRKSVDRLRLLCRLIQVRTPSVAVDVVAPIPLHRARLLERGFDQSAILARAVARALGVRCEVELLQRVIDTPHLANLDHAGRAEAIRGAFVARSAGRVLLIDDVRTTGATIAAASEAIARVGGFAFSHVLAATPRG